MNTVVKGAEFECEFCYSEFQSAKELDEHAIQHFSQEPCSMCGTNQIRIGTIWYTPHSSSVCPAHSTNPALEIEIPEEVTTDFIEVPEVEIFDIQDDNEDDVDIFDDIETADDEETLVISDEGEEADEDAEDEDAEEEEEEVENASQVRKVFRTDKCPLCKKGFNNKQKLIEHINQHNGFDTQPYSLAGLKTKKNSAENSIGDMSGGLTEEQLCSRICPICHKCIVNKQNLICHMNIHRGIKPFVCTVCQKSFAHIRNLIRHKEQQRHCEMQFTCTMGGCKKSFMSSNKLHRHIKLVHTYEVESLMEKPYPCDQCYKSFMSLGFLKMHLKRHLKR